MNTQDARPHLSVIIPTYNRPDMLAACIANLGLAIRTAGVDIQVIVSDDGDANLTRKSLAFPGIKLEVVQGPKRGPAANRNAGAAAAQAEWLVFTDDDCLPSDQWLVSFKEAIDAYSETNVFEGATCADRPRRSLAEESPTNEGGGYLWSCNFAIRKALFTKIGGFCESFPCAAMEDVDLRERLRDLGERLVFVKSALVCHPYRPAKDWRFQIQRASAYRHYLERHPHIIRKTGLTGAMMNFARKIWHLLRGTLRYGPKGWFPIFLLTVLESKEEIRQLARVAYPPKSATSGSVP